MLRLALIAPLLALWAALPAAAQQATAAADDPTLLSIDGSPVSTTEIGFWVRYIGRFYRQNHGLAHLDLEAQQDGRPLRQFLLDTAVGYARKDRAIEARARELDIVPSAAEQQQITDERTRQLRIYGSEGEYQRIVASMYGSEALYRWLQRIDLLGQKVFDRLYGEQGEGCDDACVAQYVQDEQLMGLRWLRLPAEAGTDASGAGRRRNRRQLQKARDQLAHSRDPAALFATLANDGGPKLLTAASQDPALVSAWRRLPAGGISDIVTTPAADYLLLRLPLQPAARVDEAGHTLRYQAAYQSLFQPAVAQWTRGQQVQYQPAFATLDIAALLE